MPVFQQVDGDQAGPDALGILVPPGRRTLVILRPRALDWDLLPIALGKNGGPALVFWEVQHHEAPALAEKLYHALEEAAAQRTGRVEPVASPHGDGYRILAGVPPFSLVVCPRRPGEPYRPLVVATVGEGLDAAQRIAAVLYPEPGRSQELYFNKRHFAR
jgi:hypothetical protein